MVSGATARTCLLSHITAVVVSLQPALLMLLLPPLLEPSSAFIHF